MNNYKTVTVRAEVIKSVRELVKSGYYRLSETEQRNALERLTARLCDLYGVVEPKIIIDSTSHNQYRYNVREQAIILENNSLISYLHEFRHHLQKTKGLRYSRLGIEQDARAWSLRVYSQAVPKMFREAVKAGRVHFVVWDEAAQ